MGLDHYDGAKRHAQGDTALNYIATAWKLLYRIVYTGRNNRVAHECIFGIAHEMIKVQSGERSIEDNLLEVLQTINTGQPVSRINDIYSDKSLFCACLAIESYKKTGRPSKVVSCGKSALAKPSLNHMGTNFQARNLDGTGMLPHTPYPAIDDKILRPYNYDHLIYGK